MKKRLLLHAGVITLAALFAFPAITPAQSNNTSTPGCFTPSMDPEDCESSWGSSLTGFHHNPAYSAYSQVTWTDNPDDITVNVTVVAWLLVNETLIAYSEDSDSGTGTSGTVRASVDGSFPTCIDGTAHPADVGFLSVTFYIERALIWEDITRLYPCP